MAGSRSIIPPERIEKVIYIIRGRKVMFDSGPAKLYGTSTKRFNEQIRRNGDRFPDDFMFRLSDEEWTVLRSQTATSKKGRGGRRYTPSAFTEHGAVMAANVLNSPRAVQASIEVVRAFVRLREVLASHKDLARKLTALEKKYDHQFKVVFDAIRQLMAPPEPAKRQMGFHAVKKQKK